MQKQINKIFTKYNYHRSSRKGTRKNTTDSYKYRRPTDFFHLTAGEQSPTENEPASETHEVDNQLSAVVLLWQRTIQSIRFALSFYLLVLVLVLGTGTGTGTGTLLYKWYMVFNNGKMRTIIFF